jgi:hypothetical protein
VTTVPGETAKDRELRRRERRGRALLTAEVDELRHKSVQSPLRL